MKDPVKVQSCLAQQQALLPNIADYVALHAKQRPLDLALIEHNTGSKITWKELNRSADAFAAKLLSLGLKKGDVVATSLPLLKEHVFLICACYRIGLVVAPLDLRLRASEIQACIDKIKPRAYFFVGVAKIAQTIAEVMGSSPSVQHWVQFQKEADGILPGAVWVQEFVRDIKRVYIQSKLTGSVRRARKKVGKRDPCLIIFTTGSTGSPKPGLLCHENILLQNIGLAVAFELTQTERMLVNLPPSHVGCTTEQLGTILYGGATAVLLHIFDAQKTLEAIQQHKVTMIGQIPALYNLEWRLSRYKEFDLSSLRFAIYGGQSVSKQFLSRMKEMAPLIGTGLGLTETAGFCTYTDAHAGVEELAAGIGYAAPFCPVTVREPMREDGSAGAEKGAGEVGEICLSGPQVFLGYLNDPENTKKTVSTDGFCYTGDLGTYDEQNGLRFAGRSKLIIKSRGYQVFPEDIENHVVRKLAGRVGAVAVVGVEHEVLSEAVMVFVEPAAGERLTPEEISEACADMASYKRPTHVEVLEPGSLPLNRVAKTDYLELKVRANDLAARLRAEGGWDRRRRV